MRTCLLALVVLLLGLFAEAQVGSPVLLAAADGTVLQVGFAEADITPKLDGKPVYMAGFGQNRKATAVHDPLKVRAIVLKHGDQKVALACLDVVGFFHANVRHVRDKLSGFSYVLVSSTHNHEGPDTLGLWGPTPFVSGVDPDYMKFLEERTAEAIRAADAAAKPMTARLGKAQAPELLHDGRQPYVKHDELVAVQFDDAKEGKPAGVLVQWNCHPETLGSKNTALSADYVAATVEYVHQRYHCPVVYLTGTVGGLMTSLHVEVKDDNGRPLADGTMEKTERYGKLIGQLGERALKSAQPVRLTPLAAHHREIYLPLHNKGYQMAQQLGVLPREPLVWTGDPTRAEPVGSDSKDRTPALRTEVAWLQFGDLDIAAIPGEIYPELVLDKVQDPPDPGADFPDAPIEPAIYKQLHGPHRMLIGLANDEIGYIIPKRQWDEKPPFCYGLKQAQYGEINSVGPETAPILCQAFKELAARKK